MLELVERRQDAQWAIAIVAMRRAGALGRAPIIEDLEIAQTSLAYDGSGPADFTRWRARRLSGIAHDPDLRQHLADVVILAGEFPPSADLDAVEQLAGDATPAHGGRPHDHVMVRAHDERDIRLRRSRTTPDETPDAPNPTTRGEP